MNNQIFSRLFGFLSTFVEFRNGSIVLNVFAVCSVGVFLVLY